MEPTVSGNGIPENPDTGKEIHEKEETVKPAETEKTDSSESVTNNYTYETYEIDNSEVTELLKELISETEKNNESLGSIADSLEIIKEHLTAEPEEDASDEAHPDGKEVPAETEISYKEILDMLEGIEETFAGMKETGESIYDSVSGNSLYLEDISGSMQDYIETYAETSEIQNYKSTYSLAVNISILFAACAIAGLFVTALVFRKLR